MEIWKQFSNLLTNRAMGKQCPASEMNFIELDKGIRKDSLWKPKLSVKTQSTWELGV